MGLTINSLSIMNGIATVDNVYAKIRDLKTTKRNNNLPLNNNNAVKYELEFRVLYEKDGKFVNNEFYRELYDTPITDDIWITCYSYLKQKLTEKGLTHSDVF